MTKRKFKYFVSYTYRNEENIIGFGNAEIESEKDVTSFEDVNTLTGLIVKKQPNLKDVVVLNWKYLNQSGRNAG